MRRIVLVFGSVVTAAACGGSGGGGSTAPTAVAVAQGWSGTVQYTASSNGVLGSQKETWEGSAEFVRDPDGSDLQPLTPGSVYYAVKSGSLKVTTTTTGGCTAQGGTTRPLVAADGYIIVEANGSYTGKLNPTAAFPLTVSCPAGTTSVPWGGGMALLMSGNVTNLRMTGEMKGVDAVKASWDLFYVAR
jgi:hypothetical protein